MIIFPNAKINLGLRVIDRRSDDFHNIETVFVPIDLCDVLEFVQSDNNKNSLTISGIIPDNVPEDNLVQKAWSLMNMKYGIPFIDIQLHKVIPIGAGLGGGSSDAAFMLKALNEFFNCACDNIELKKMAAVLGSDCPFFIENTSAIGTGRGEKLQSIDLPLNDYKLLLVNPGIHISSKEAYCGVTLNKKSTSLKELVNKPRNMWRDFIYNDFEDTIFLTYPKIKKIKLAMYEAGAVYASMTGSGSTVFGLFSKIEKSKAESLFSDYFFSIIDVL